jgi:hypothetical protein
MPNISLDIAMGSYNPPVNYWCFVPHQYFGSNYIDNYFVNQSRNITIISNTRIISTRMHVANSPKRFFAAGPSPREVEQYSHSKIRPLVIKYDNQPGKMQLSNAKMGVFRPRISRTNVSPDLGQRSVPTHGQQFVGSGQTSNGSIRVQSKMVLINDNNGNVVQRQAQHRNNPLVNSNSGTIFQKRANGTTMPLNTVNRNRYLRRK